MEKTRTRNKWILYITILFIIILLESTLLQYVKILDGKPMALLPYAVGTIAMLEGIYGGSAAGLAAGILYDAILSPTNGFYTIVYVVCGALIGILCNFIFWKTYLVTLLYVAITILFSSLIYYVVFMLVFGHTNPMVLLKGLPGEFLSTLIFTPFIYWAVRGTYQRFRAPDEEI